MDLRRLIYLIKGVIMGIIDKTKKKQTLETSVTQKKLSDNSLTKPELEFLLKLIANSAFQGKDVQLIYDLTAKLQKQYSK